MQPRLLVDQSCWSVVSSAAFNSLSGFHNGLGKNSFSVLPLVRCALPGKSCSYNSSLPCQSGRSASGNPSWDAVSINHLNRGNCQIPGSLDESAIIVFGHDTPQQQSEIFLIDPNILVNTASLAAETDVDGFSCGQNCESMYVSGARGQAAGQAKGKRPCAGLPSLSSKTKEVCGSAEEEKADSRRDWVNQTWVTSKEEKLLLSAKGVKWRSGMWSAEEEILLRDNIAEYCRTRKLPDPCLMIFATPKEERKAFYRTIAAGLNRPLFAVYRKVLRMYDHRNYLGKYSPSELEQLSHLHKFYNNDWQTIGTVLGRSASSVKDRARLMKGNLKKGKWLPEEEQLLSRAVRAHTNTEFGQSVTCNINFAKIAEVVKTRTEKQCRAKWLNYLNWKEVGGDEWVKQDELELVQRVLAANVSDENELDWTALASDWPSVRSPQWLRVRWWHVKRKVPGYLTRSFKSLLEYLETTYLAILREKISRSSVGDPVSDTDHLTQSLGPTSTSLLSTSTSGNCPSEEGALADRLTDVSELKSHKMSSLGPCAEINLASEFDPCCVDEDLPALPPSCQSSSFFAPATAFDFASPRMSSGISVELGPLSSCIDVFFATAAGEGASSLPSCAGRALDVAASSSVKEAACGNVSPRIYSRRQDPCELVAPIRPDAFEHHQDDFEPESNSEAAVSVAYESE